MLIAAANTGVTCLQFFGGAYPEVELLWYVGILTFQGITVLFSISAASFHIPTLTAQGSDVSTSSTTLGVFQTWSLFGL